tara:strand:- start:25687 stop:26805 length:1119 start_codon:yes stop_codon:yes gene_type:complete
VEDRLMELSDEEIERYSRQIVMDEIGFEGQQKLKNARVTVIGVGGLGSPITQQLVAMGIGTVRIVDRDVVEISNLHRQVLYGDEDVGLSKAEAAHDRLKRINPKVMIEPLTLSINDDTVDEAINNSDVVIDGLDSVSARYSINRACVRLKIPYIFGSAIVTTGSSTSIIPGKTPCLECFQPALKDDEMPKCGTEGVHPAILTTVSSVQVSEAIRIIIGKEPNLANKLFLADVANLDYDKVKIIKQFKCNVCGPDADLTIKKSKRKLIEDICGREGKSVHIISPKENLEINLDKLNNILENDNLEIIRKGELGTTLNYNEKITVSIVTSGVSIIVGALEEKRALEIFSEIIINKLEINPEKVHNEFQKLLKVN